MADVANLARMKGAHLKKTVSLFALELAIGASQDQVPLAGGSFLIGKLPPNSIITSAFAFVKEASDGTTAVATLGTASGGTQVMTGGDLATAGKSGTTVVSDTGPGRDLWLNVAFTGTPTAKGKFVVTVEYYEYAKNNGDYTAL